MLLPKTIPAAIPGDAKSRRLAEKVAEARAQGDDSLLAKMWVYSGLHLAPYNIFDFRVSRHRDGPDDFFREQPLQSARRLLLGKPERGASQRRPLGVRGLLGARAPQGRGGDDLPARVRVAAGDDPSVCTTSRRARKEMTWQDRQALRLRESTIILDAIRQWLDSEPLGAVLPKSDFAEALRYLRNHWQALNVYVRDGRIPIDNNSVEQLMKQVAMGRKAWLFVCSVAGGEQSAKMMTLVSSARRHDLDVWVYIKDVLDQLLAGSTDYHSLLPDVWKQTHPEAVRDYRVEERRDKAERKQLRAARRRLAARDRR